MENTPQITNWMDEELNLLRADLPQTYPNPLKLKPNVITTIVIDFTAPFEVWTDREDDTKIKAIIPCWENEEPKTFWLNKKNPIYHQILQAGKEGQRTFKILQTGDKGDTRYTLIKEE